MDRIPKLLRTLVPARDLRYLTGFTDEQLRLILERVLELSLKERMENLLWRVFLVWEYQIKQERLPSAGEIRR